MDSLAGKIIAAALSLLTIGGLGALVYNATTTDTQTTAAVTVAVQTATAAQAAQTAKK